MQTVNFPFPDQNRVQTKSAFQPLFRLVHCAACFGGTVCAQETEFWRFKHQINNFNNLLNAKVILQIYNCDISVSGGGDTVPPRVRDYPRAFPAMLCVKLKF